jgi:hypothetical protein
VFRCLLLLLLFILLLIILIVCSCPCSCYSNGAPAKISGGYSALFVRTVFQVTVTLCPFTQEPARRQQQHGFPKTSACSCLIGCQTQSPLYSKPPQRMGEIQTISSPGSREFLYSRHTEFTDNIKYFVTVQDFIMPYGRCRNLTF